MCRTRLEELDLMLSMLVVESRRTKSRITTRLESLLRWPRMLEFELERWKGRGRQLGNRCNNSLDLRSLGKVNADALERIEKC